MIGIRHQGKKIMHKKGDHSIFKIHKIASKNLNKPAATPSTQRDTFPESYLVSFSPLAMSFSYICS